MYTAHLHGTEPGTEPSTGAKWFNVVKSNKYGMCSTVTSSPLPVTDISGDNRTIMAACLSIVREGRLYRHWHAQYKDAPKQSKQVSHEFLFIEALINIVK